MAEVPMSRLGDENCLGDVTVFVYKTGWIVQSGGSSQVVVGSCRVLSSHNLAAVGGVHKEKDAATLLLNAIKEAVTETTGGTE